MLLAPRRLIAGGATTIRLPAFALAAVLTAGQTLQPVYAQQSLGYEPSPQSFKEGDLEAVHIRPNVWMISGAGGNIVAQIGWMGIVLVDTGSAGTSEKILTVLKRIAPNKRIRFIFNTGPDDDHVGNNEAIAQAGRNLMLYVPPDDNGNGGFGGSDLETNKGAAGVMAQENLLTHMQADKKYTSFAWPTELFSGARVKGLYLNDEAIQAIYQPAAHSDADSIVHFRSSDVIATGDVLDLRHLPVIDAGKGGTINGTINALTRLIELSTGPVPLTWHADRTLVVPGHGRVSDQGEIVEYRDMLVMVRDRIDDLVKKGRNLEQIKAANPTEGFNRQYGSDAAMKDAFITAVHKTLNVKP